MASPFSVFRKNQKVMLAVLAITAMVAFVFLDPVMRYLGQGPQVENPVVVETKYGKWTQAQLDNFRAQREFVNRFLQYVTSQTVMAENKAGRVQPHQLDLQAQQLYMIWHQLLMERTKPGPEEAAIETIVLSRRAQEIGMVVNEQTVNELIRQITNNSLTNEVLDQIVGQLYGGSTQAGWERLFKALETELLASKLSQFFIQSVRDSTPAQRFAYYEALNRRAKIEAMPLPVSGFVSQVTAEPTAADIQKLYDDHRNAYPDPSSPEPGFKEPKRASFQYFKADYAKLVEEFKPQITDAEIAEYYEKNKAQFRATELPSDDPDKPAEGNKPAEGDKPAEDKPAEGDKPAAEKPAADAPAADKPAEEKPAEEKPADEKPADNPQTMRGDGAAFRLVSQETPAAEQPTETPTAPPAAETPPAADKPTATDPPAREAPAAEKPADEKPAEPAAGEEKPAEPAAAEEKAAEEKPEEIKYQPLEKVRDLIRDNLAGNKANEKMAKTFEELQGVMRRFADDRDIYNARKEKTGKPPVFPFEELAKQHGLEAKSLDMVTATEAADTDIGKVNRITMASSFNIRRQPFNEFAFADSLVTYRPEAGQDDENNGYLYWKTDEKAAYVPTLEQIRDQVVLAWKSIQARELARKRAEELATQARAANKPLTEVFAAQKDLPVTESDWFSWLTTGAVPLDPTGGQPRISEVEGVTYPDDDFMKAVFHLNAGEVAVAPNHPQAIYYVVRLAEYERPLDELRNDFALEPPPRYMMVADRDRRKLYLDWLAGLNEQAKVHWNRPADAEVRRVASNQSDMPLDAEF